MKKEGGRLSPPPLLVRRNIVRGVNIGGWLVLEKWMTPELYEGYEAEDEYHLLEARPDKLDMLKKHRDTFIKKADFAWIKNHGIDTIRLPVGHWLFDASEPYIDAKNYVDQAFLWAKEIGLKIVLDLHAAKGCQNGFDNGGLSGVIGWHKDSKNIDQTIAFLEKLTKTYQHEEALSGIQLLNEPHWTIPMDLLQSFYLKAYQCIRKIVGEDIAILMHDGFRIDAWEDFFKQHHFVNTYLDTHMYQVFGEVKKDASFIDLMDFIKEKRIKQIHALQVYTKVIIGEWSCALPHQTKEHLDDRIIKDAHYNFLSNLLLLTFEEADGWFFWNYKLSQKSTEKNIGWSFRDFVEKGYLPFKREE